MKKAKDAAPASGKIPAMDPEANKKRARRLEIQKDVLRKIMYPLTELINDASIEDKTKKRKKWFFEC